MSERRLLSKKHRDENRVDCEMMSNRYGAYDDMQNEPMTPSFGNEARNDHYLGYI